MDARHRRTLRVALSCVHKATVHWQQNLDLYAPGHKCLALEEREREGDETLRDIQVREQNYDLSTYRMVLQNRFTDWHLTADKAFRRIQSATLPVTAYRLYAGSSSTSSPPNPDLGTLDVASAVHFSLSSYNTLNNTTISKYINWRGRDPH